MAPKFRGKNLIIIVLTLSLIFNLFFFARQVIQPALWNPFTDYPVATFNLPHTHVVSKKLDGTVVEGDYPTIVYREGEPLQIPVHIKKCSNAEKPFKVEQTVGYQFLAPREATVVGLTTINSERLTGCREGSFEVVAPAEVMTELKRQIKPESPVLFKSGGIDTPVDPDTGLRGQSKAWETETLAIVLPPQ